MPLILRPPQHASIRRAVPRGWIARVALAVSLWLAAGAGPARAADDTMAKADIIWNIAKFVTWPPSSLGPVSSPLVVTVVGEDDLAIAIANQLSTRSVGGRNVFVRFARRAKDARGSHLVYVASSESARVDEVLAELKGTPALTVADVEGFVKRGGMVDFTQEQGRTRFRVHAGNVEAAGLKVSSRLLALAQVVGAGH